MKQSLAWPMAAVVAALPLCAAPLSAFADPQTVVGPYGSVGYTETYRDGAGMGSVDLKFGDRFNPYLGAEGELGLGVNRDNASDISATAGEKQSYSIAGYGVGFVPVGHGLTLLGRVGVGETRFSLADAGVFSHADLVSVNYGAGAMVNLSRANLIRVDYTRKSYDSGGGDADTWGLSFVHRF